MCLFIRMHICVCVVMYIFVYVCVCARVCVHVCLCVCMCVHVQVCILTCVYAVYLCLCVYAATIFYYLIIITKVWGTWNGQACRTVYYLHDYDSQILDLVMKLQRQWLRCEGNDAKQWLNGYVVKLSALILYPFNNIWIWFQNFL